MNVHQWKWSISSLITSKIWLKLTAMSLIAQIRFAHRMRIFAIVIAVALLSNRNLRFIFTNKEFWKNRDTEVNVHATLDASDLRTASNFPIIFSMISFLKLFFLKRCVFINTDHKYTLWICETFVNILMLKFGPLNPWKHCKAIIKIE